MNRFQIMAIFAGLCLAGCDLQTQQETTGFVAPKNIEIFRQGPKNAQAGTCWGKDETPAVVEITSRRVMTEPAQRDANGVITRPPIYETISDPKMITDRETVWFEAPCPEVFTPDFIRSLQRALALRKLYAGPNDGILNPATKAAIRNFQEPQGLNSSELSLVAAKKLGLVAYDRAQIAKF